MLVVVITILTTLTTTIQVYAGDYALQPSKHFFKSNGNPSMNEEPLDDTTTAMQPIEENKTSVVVMISQEFLLDFLFHNSLRCDKKH